MSRLDGHGGPGGRVTGPTFHNRAVERMTSAQFMAALCQLPAREGRRPSWHDSVGRTPLSARRLRNRRVRGWR